MQETLDDQLPEISKWFKPDVMNNDMENGKDEIPAITCPPALAPTTDSNSEASTSFQETVDVPHHTNPSSSFNRIFEKLKQIFVGKDPEELISSALRNENIDDAINAILDSKLDNNGLSGEEIVYT